MRIAVVSHAATIAVNQEPFDALARAGADVTVYAPRALRTDLRGLVRLERLDGSRATLVPLQVLLGGYRPLIGQAGIHLLVYRGLRRALTAARPDVVFVEEEAYSLAARQVLATGLPFVIHENQNIDRGVPRPFEMIRRAVLSRAAGVTVRNAAAADLVRAHGFSGPVESFPHAVDPTRFEHLERRADLPRPVVGFVGRVVEEKGILDLIAALSSLAERPSLLVVGDGPLLERARDAASGLRARFTGAVAHDDAPGWYGSMDLVAIPSHTTPTWMEQFGRIVIEANAAGVPVVVSDSGELPNTVAATGGGVVAPERDVPALARAIGGLLADPMRARALGDAGRAAVHQRFTPASVSERLLAFLRTVAG